MCTYVFIIVYVYYVCIYVLFIVYVYYDCIGKIMQQLAPHVNEWVGRLWNTKQSTLKKTTAATTATTNTNPATSTVQELITPFFEQLFISNYLVYLHANYQAYSKKADYFTYTKRVYTKGTDGGTVLTNITYEVPVVPYRVYCYQQLQKCYYTLSPSSKEQVQCFLHKYNCYDPFFANIHTSDHIITCTPELGIDPPFCPNNDNNTGTTGASSTVLAAKWNEQHVFRKYIKYYVYTSITSNIWCLPICIGIIYYVLHNK